MLGCMQDYVRKPNELTTGGATSLVVCMSETFESAEAMDIDEKKPEAEGSSKASAEKKEEPPTHQLSNPARIVPAQERLVSFPAASRWQPLANTSAVSGILVLRDTAPGELQSIYVDRYVCVRDSGLCGCVSKPSEE